MAQARRVFALAGARPRATTLAAAWAGASAKRGFGAAAACHWRGSMGPKARAHPPWLARCAARGPAVRRRRGRGLGGRGPSGHEEEGRGWGWEGGGGEARPGRTGKEGAGPAGLEGSTARPGTRTRRGGWVGGCWAISLRPVRDATMAAAVTAHAGGRARMRALDCARSEPRARRAALAGTVTDLWLHREQEKLVLSSFRVRLVMVLLGASPPSRRLS